MACETTRRQFVSQAAGACTAAVALAGVGASRAFAAEAAKAEDVAWDEQADFVVLGIGASGLGAIKRALIDNDGLTVIALEKCDEAHAGGAFSCAHGLFGGVDFCDAYPVLSHGQFSEELRDRMKADTVTSAQWIIDNGLELAESAGTYRWANGSYDIWKTAYDAVKDLDGLTLHFEVTTTQLVQDGAGRVTGVIAEVEGERKAIGATRGVLLCTGNYAGDAELFRGIHEYALPYAPACPASEVGDGIFLASQAGAVTFENVSRAFEWFCWAMAKPSEELGEGMVLNDPMSNGDTALWSRIFVNAAGKRFMDESVNFMHDHSFLPFQPWERTSAPSYLHYTNLPMWTVYDAKIPSTHRLWIQDEGNLNWSYAKTRDVYQWSEDNEAEVERGWVYKADTLEELAEQMVAHHIDDGAEFAVDRDAFIETVRAYNEMCAAGEDADFGKGGDYLVPLDTPPSYAVETVPLVGYTISGLTTTEEGAVLNGAHEPIPGLYAAGDITAHGSQTNPLGCCPAFIMGMYLVDGLL